jgi:hypothetical protein
MIGDPDRHIPKAKHLPASTINGRRGAEQRGSGFPPRNDQLRPNIGDIGKHDRAVVPRFLLGWSPIAQSTLRGSFDRKEGPCRARGTAEPPTSSCLPSVGLAHLRLLRNQIRHRRQRSLRLSGSLPQGDLRQWPDDSPRRHRAPRAGGPLVSPEAVAVAVRAYAKETNPPEP